MRHSTTTRQHRWLQIQSAHRLHCLFAGLLAGLLVAAGLATADHHQSDESASWYPSRYGAEDALSVVAVGADSWAVAVLPSDVETDAFPVHPELLAKNGVYILDNMHTRALAKDALSEFLFVLGQPKFVGAVQAVINPVAIR